MNKIHSFNVRANVMPIEIQQKQRDYCKKAFFSQ